MPWIFDALAAADAFLVDAAASPWMLPVLALVCLIDAVFPPVPSEVVLLSAVAVTWVSQPQAIVVVVIAATLGAWAGDNLAYVLGRRLGMTPFPWLRGGRRAAAVERVRSEFHRRPESIILTGRFVPVARVLVNLTAGAARLPYRRFVVLSLASATAWASVSALLAVLVGALVTTQPLLGTTIAVAIALTGGVVVDRVLAWRRHTSERATE